MPSGLVILPQSTNYWPAIEEKTAVKILINDAIEEKKIPNKTEVLSLMRSIRPGEPFLRAERLLIGNDPYT